MKLANEAAAGLCHTTQTSGESSLRIWLADPFCFTPWYSAALAGALRTAGADIRLIATNVSREPDYFARCGLQTDPGPFRLREPGSRWNPKVRKFMRAATVAANTVSLIQTLRRNSEARPSVLHLQQLPALNHGVSIDFSLIATAQRCGIPVVHTVHNLLPHDSGEKLRPVYQRLYATVDYLICHSPDIAETLSSNFGIPSHSLSVVPHGPLFESDEEEGSQAGARRRLGIAPSRPVVLWQGIMAPYKGLDVLLKAWTTCMRDWGKGEESPLLLIAGAGAAAEELLVEAAAQAHPGTIRADIRYIAAAELPDYYRAADLLVFPYKKITTSGALLTGLSYCKPIVASDLSPFREYLHQGQNAILIPPDDTNALAAALTPLMQDVARVGRAFPAQLSIHNSESPRYSYRCLLHGSAQNKTLYTGWDIIAKRTLAIYRHLVR